jgi:hypothetical protein
VSTGGDRSSLRRSRALLGAALLLALVVTAPAVGAVPAPDPPPLPAPDPVPTQAATPAATQPRVSRPAPVAPSVVVARPQQVAPARTAVTKTASKTATTPKPKAKAAKKPARPVARPRAVVRIPHDRGPVPLAAFVAAEELDRGLLATAGLVLLLAALGSAVFVLAMRRQVLVAALVLLGAAPGAVAAPSPVSYSISGTAGTNGWYTSNVTITWTVVNNGDLESSTCPLADQITAEGTSTRQCTTKFTWGTVVSPPEPLVIRIDKTPPVSVSGSLARAPDSEGWYNHTVGASFSGQDSVSGIAGCSNPTYAGGDSASAGLSGTCTDVAGNVSAAASVGLKYDATPPTVTPTPERQPDHKGWYRKPVTISFAGADGMSGLATCSASARYAGPDLEKAAVAGSCRDRAGNVGEASHTFPFDATAPKIERVEARLDKGAARLGWARPPDAARVEIVRSPGVNGAKATTVYEGTGAAFVDRTIRAGVRYRYAISMADLAGNVATKTVTALEQAVLYGPAPGATLRLPPTLRWQAVKGARFYNVQLYRGSKKILSAWPKTASLRLATSWSFAGKRQRLVPGLYRWYVWPARGTRERPTYGRVLGSSTFRVAR